VVIVIALAVIAVGVVLDTAVAPSGRPDPDRRRWGARPGWIGVSVGDT
jgi:hypothetical protein